MEQIITFQKDNYLISTDKSKLNIDTIHQFLSKSYWASDRPRSVIEKSIKHSICFGVYDGEKQIGFARVVTDCAVFAYIMDLFIIESYQQKGLGKWLMECILDHPELTRLKRWVLATKDAHGFYEKFGFRVITTPEYVMEFIPELKQQIINKPR